MSAGDPVPPARVPGPLRLRRALILLAGLVACQAILYGPSLVGARILLPLDILGMRQMYLPAAGGAPPADDKVSDLVLQVEPFRRYAAAEVRAGRLPLWNPFDYCGSPFLANSQSAVLSPFRLLDYAWPDPAAVAWGQLLRALVAGIGAYLFFRRALGCGFGASLAGAWCYPISGFLVLWAGFTIGATAQWLPWTLLAADAAVRRPGPLAAAGLAAATAATVLSGHVATAAQVLLATGAYAAWALVTKHRWRGILGRPASRSLLCLAAGLLLGVLLSAPQTLPTAEYVRGSSRLASRVAGERENPYLGLGDLPQTLLPYSLGSTARGALYLPPVVRLEGGAAAYAGLLLTLVAAPLAWGDRSRRPVTLLLAILALASLSPIYGIPPFAQLLGAWPLNLLRGNRMAFAAGFSLLSLGVIGLNALARREGPDRRIVAASLALIAALGVWSLDRAIAPPDAVVRQVEAIRSQILDGSPPGGFPDEAAVRGAALGFALASVGGGALCVLAAALLLLARHAPEGRRPGVALLIGALACAEGLAMAFGVNPQCDPALYYPPIPVLEKLRALPPGRIAGSWCLPPNLNLMAGLADVRGYDAADPDRMVELVRSFADDRLPVVAYARTQWMRPIFPSGIADMLSLRYVVHRGTPPAWGRALLSGGDYLVLVNDRALPRAYVPRRAEVENDGAGRLRRLAAPEFDPRAVALVEGRDPAAVPAGEVVGAVVAIEDPDPGRVRVEVAMETPGVLVLADSWDPGWRATDDGAPLPVLRVNHALRGVVLPAGRHLVVFDYAPASFRIGLALAGAGGVGLLGLVAVAAARDHRRPTVPAR